MKHFLAILALSAFVAVGAHSAWAISVQADAPVAYSLTQTQSGGGGTTLKHTSGSGTTSGGIVGLNIAWFGVQYEDYTISQSLPSVFGTGNENLEVQMYDLVLNLPFPILHVSIGGGVGTGHLSGSALSNITTNKDADLTGYFAQVGIPIGMLSDLHFSYRQFSGTNKLTPIGGSQFDFKQEAEVYTLGLLIGW